MWGSISQTRRVLPLFASIWPRSIRGDSDDARKRHPGHLPVPGATGEGGIYVTDAPLVSCVMPTRDRRRSRGRRSGTSCARTTASKELIVLDDGDDAIEDLTRGDERIRYVRLPSEPTVGAKRNLGCELARGELVAHWDDDDWIGHGRLSAQVSELTASGADVHACARAPALPRRRRRRVAAAVPLAGGARPAAGAAAVPPVAGRRAPLRGRPAPASSGAFAAGLAPARVRRRRRPLVRRRRPSDQPRRSQPRRRPLDGSAVRRGRRAARDRRAFLRRRCATEAEPDRRL